MNRAAQRVALALLALGASSALRAQEIVLFDNGGIATTPPGPDGASRSQVQTALGLAVTGHAAVIANDQRVADDFVVPAGGWRVARFEFDAFQPGTSPGVAPFDRLHLRIWDGEPGALGSSVVFGDLATNRLVGSVFANVYRVTGIGLDVERPVFTATAGVGTLVLAPGAYWVEWQIGAQRAGGPHVPPGASAGLVVGGNARQFAGGWRAVVDGASPQSLPFRVIGEAGTGGAAPDTLFANGYEN